MHMIPRHRLRPPIPPAIHRDADTVVPTWSTDESTRSARRHDIYHTAFLLRQRLAPDLVPSVLADAELFDSLTAKWTNPLSKNAVAIPGPPRAVMVTPPFPATQARTKRPVRSVRFEVESHDQGSADRVDQGSWTWFSARIVKPTQQGGEAEVPHFPVGEEDGTDRKLYRNVVASKEWKWHDIEWSVDSENEEEANWVANVDVGDRIVVLAWAHYANWSNYVREVRVTVNTIVCCR